MRIMDHLVCEQKNYNCTSSYTVAADNHRTCISLKASASVTMLSLQCIYYTYVTLYKLCYAVGFDGRRGLFSVGYSLSEGQ